MFELHRATLLTVGDAAKALNVAPETIRLWERIGKLRGQRTVGGVRLFDAAEVERLAETRRDSPITA